MKKEFGKWLMDVAKYLATAVLISSVFNDLGESAAIYRVGGLTMAMLLGLGLALVKDKPTGKIKNRKGGDHMNGFIFMCILLMVIAVAGFLFFTIQEKRGKHY